jgi:L-ascorbate metabolism protein UlaG (beta-lactamase superfamily)
MEIIWYGQACFRLRSRGLSVVTDPYGGDLGIKLPRITATVVTVSHSHDDHNNVQAVKGSPFIISGPGEYEIEGIFVIGVSTFHDAKKGEELGRNTAYLIEFEDLTICHLGDLGHVPDQEQIEQLNSVDILLVPVGGHTTLTASKAAEVIGLLEPKVVIPMHYQIPGLNLQLNGVTRFLKEMAIEAPEKQESLTISKSQLPEETQVFVLEPKQ